MKNTAEKMTQIEKYSTRELNGGKQYMCIHCGYRSSNYGKTYANALKCVTLKYGYTVWRIVSSIL